jgi:hypothetical protein
MLQAAPRELHHAWLSRGRCAIPHPRQGRCESLPWSNPLGPNGRTRIVLCRDPAEPANARKTTWLSVYHDKSQIRNDPERIPLRSHERARSPPQPKVRGAQTTPEPHFERTANAAGRPCSFARVGISLAAERSSAGEARHVRDGMLQRLRSGTSMRGRHGSSVVRLSESVVVSRALGQTGYGIRRATAHHDCRPRCEKPPHLAHGLRREAGGPRRCRSIPRGMCLPGRTATQKRQLHFTAYQPAPKVDS